MRIFDDLVRRLPVLILLGIDMPVLNGFQVLEGIRGNPLLREIPVIAFTARTGQDKQPATHHAS